MSDVFADLSWRGLVYQTTDDERLPGWLGAGQSRNSEPRLAMADKEKKPIQQLRDLHGGMSEELKAYYKELNRARKLLKQALKAGPKTVPELARETGLEPPATMWHVMAMNMLCLHASWIILMRLALHSLTKYDLH